MNLPYRGAEPGSTGDLVGTVFPLIFWVSPRGASWSPLDKSCAERNLRQGHQWLELQAKRWGNSVRILPGRSLGRERDIQLPRVPGGYGSQEEALEWMRDLTSYCGLGTPGQLYDRILRQYPSCDRVHATVMVNRAGRSYALCSPGDPCADSMLAAAINYRPTVSGTISWRTIAHEVLHLYGAWDLYPTDCVSTEQADHARRIFPRDIMGSVPLGVSPVVGGLTAWRVGWSAQAQPWFAFFEPKSIHRTHEAWETPATPPPSNFRIWIDRMRSWAHRSKGTEH